MGMAPHMTDRWNAEHASYTSAQQHTSDIGGTFSGASKAFRYMLQSAALGAGAYLTIIGDIQLGHRRRQGACRSHRRGPQSR
jgi:ABC-type protease/lipase transport system fused ATPase/permease subunit